MFSLWVLIIAFPGVIGCFNSWFLQSKKGSACNYNSDLFRYSTKRDMTETVCTIKCFTLPGCEHSMLHSETRECYVEDKQGAVSCGSDCNRLLCFDYTEVRNVAFGARTECSTEYSSLYSCDKAVDDIDECVWASLNEGQGNWIKIDLGSPRILTHARFMQRISPSERNKDIRLVFSDGSTQQFQLPYHNIYAFLWDEIQLEPVKTTWVKVIAQSVWTQLNNGWAGIQLFARVRKDLNAPQNLTSLARSDYMASCGP